MKETARTLARLIESAARAYERKWYFLGMFVLVFAASVFALGQLGLLPEPSKAFLFLTKRSLSLSKIPSRLEVTF